MHPSKGQTVHSTRQSLSPPTLFISVMDDLNRYRLFTWSNRQAGKFNQLFDECHVENVITYSSDHYAILMSINKKTWHSENNYFKIGFKYEAMWATAPDYNEVVEKNWNDGFEGARNLHSI